MRLWLKFRRADAVAYISHLDAQRAYYRMFRRAALPLQYSQGFNPHPILSLAIPLPLGFGSEADYIDMTLSEPLPVLEVEKRLLSVSGSEHLQFVGLKAIVFKAPPLASIISWGRYEIEVAASDGVIEQACASFTMRDQVPFIKETKRASREVDARKLSRELNCSGDKLRVLLSLGEPAVFRPEELLNVLGAESGVKLSVEMIRRVEMYVGRDDLLTPLEWAVVESEKSG